MKTVILPFASLSTHAFHVLDTTRSNPFQEHGTTLDRSPRQVIHPFQKRAMVVVSQHKPGENVSDHNISSGPNDEASSSGALQPSLPVNNANFPVKEGNQGNMPEQSVWVKVIQKTGGDNYEDLGDPFQIVPRPANVSDLRKKVKEEAANNLAHVDANELLVFAPDKDYENDKNKMNPWDAVEEIKTSSNERNAPCPLIVVATKEKLNKQEEPSAKKAKNFSELVAKDDYQAAVKLLKESAGGYLARGFDPKVYREPHLSMGTWNKEEIQQQLCEKRELIEKRLASFKPTDVRRLFSDFAVAPVSEKLTS